MIIWLIITGVHKFIEVLSILISIKKFNYSSKMSIKVKNFKFFSLKNITLLKPAIYEVWKKTFIHMKFRCIWQYFYKKNTHCFELSRMRLCKVGEDIYSFVIFIFGWQQIKIILPNEINIFVAKSFTFCLFVVG